MYDYVKWFEDENAQLKRSAHPAEIVSFYLGSNNDGKSRQHMKQLELWYAQYAAKRNGAMFKSCNSIVCNSVSKFN